MHHGPFSKHNLKLHHTKYGVIRSIIRLCVPIQAIPASEPTVIHAYHRPVRDQFWDQVLANFWCNVNMRL